MGLFFLVGTLNAGAADTPFDFEDALKKQQYDAIIEEVRCLVCQNQNLADSHADLAQDLRREIYEMVVAGKSDDEILEFLVARYGDFVLYRPPLRGTTLLLWFGPFIVLLASLVFIARFVKGRQGISDGTLTEQEQAKLKAILDRQRES